MSEYPCSLVDPWRSFEQPLLFKRLGLLSLEKRWEVLTAFRNAELATPEVRAFHDELADHFRARLLLSPIVDREHIDEAAEKAVHHAQTRNLHTAMVYAQMAAGKDLGDLMHLADLDPLRQAVAQHGSAIVLPIHAKAIEAGVYSISTQMPSTLVVSQTAGIPDTTTLFDDLVGPVDLNIHRAPNSSVLIRCVKAAKSGRVLILPPEFTSNENDLVLRYEVAGREVGVPYAYVELARRLKIPLLPMLFEQQDDCTYRWQFLGPYDAEDEVDGVPAAIEAVFSMVQTIFEQDPTEWEGWYMFDRMIADGERAVREAQGLALVPN